MKLHTREESGIVLTRQLEWRHDGERIDHPNIVELFNRSLVVTEEGEYRIVLPHDWCRVTVEDCAYAVVAVDRAPDDRLSIRLSDRTAEWLDVPSLGVDPEGAFTVRVKAGRARARFSRPAQVALGAFLTVHDDAAHLTVGARSTPVPGLDRAVHGPS